MFCFAGRCALVLIRAVWGRFCSGWGGGRNVLGRRPLLRDGAAYKVSEDVPRMIHACSPFTNFDYRNEKRPGDMPGLVGV